jgi:glycosyltransferase involved in cell wall biosynthesis
MKVLFSCENFSYLTGCPLYVYEMARGLIKEGHEVTIISKTGGEIVKRAKEAGIRVVDIMGIESIAKEKFDIIHANQQFSGVVLDVFNGIPAVYTLHSEYDYENPLIHDSIKERIAIRPSIKEKWGLDAHIVYNPVDFDRFKPQNTPSKPFILFVGTIDHLREEAAFKVAEIAREKNLEVIFVGHIFDTWIRKMPKHCKYLSARWDIETLVQECTYTAGILLGRTTIEGWACGKAGYIFDIDLHGKIKSYELHEVPQDMSKFDSKIVVKKILEIYNKAINK